jgi:outer membrane protein insertion porin family
MGCLIESLASGRASAAEISSRVFWEGCFLSVTAITSDRIGRKAAMSALLCSAMTVAINPAMAQTSSATAPVAVPGTGTISTISIIGSQRLEPDTVRSYIQLRPGQRYTSETLDQAIRDLFETELFADATIRANGGEIIIEVRENPVINRIVLEGNKRLKEDKIRPEIKLAPRQIFTRSKTRADVTRIIELYRRQGRFAANVEPKMVQLDQNRVDIVFEIDEGPKSKVRRINIIGNEKFKDDKLRGEMATQQASFSNPFASRTSYDADRMAFDQAKMRQFYLTQGYADFRVVSSVAELTANKRDFIITYVVEEGERYKFGDVAIESELRDFKPQPALVPMKKGDWYNAKQVEDTVESLTESAGLFGYAFAEVNPNFERDKETLTMNLTFKIGDAPRVYVERIDINGNTLTQDKVVRREFRLAEGDAFNSFSVRRSSDRIQSLGFFQEKLEIEQKPGSTPDRIILEANVEEKSTGELQLSAGFSSLERFIFNFSVRQRNFRGKGQELRASASVSSFSKSIELGFTEPYFLNRNIAIGGDIFRRDFNSFNFVGNDRNTTYEQVTTGGQIRAGLAITEFWSLALRYGLNYDEITLDRNQFFSNGQCSPLLAGRYLCDAIGNRTTSSIGYSVVFDNLNNRIRPSAGQRMIFSQDLAGLGGSVKYLRSRLNADKYWRVFGNFIFSVGLEGGHIAPFGKSRGATVDRVRINDRFFLGEPEMRGFDIRGIGPRVLRNQYDFGTATLISNPNDQTADSLGGRAYYKGRMELEIPLGSGARELGLRPSLFLDVGSVFSVKRPTLTTLANTFTDAGSIKAICRNNTTGAQTFAGLTTPGSPPSISNTFTTCPTGTSFLASPFEESFLGDTWKPRVSVGFGVNWRSPFGPFRIDIAKALVKYPGDETKLFTFNVGTQF